MVTVPGATLVASPWLPALLLTVATEVVDDVHVPESVSDFTVPSLYVPSSSICVVFPSTFVVITGFAGLIATDCSVAVEAATAPVVVTPYGLDPAANGDPLTAVSAPLTPSMPYTDTIPEL